MIEKEYEYLNKAFAKTKECIATASGDIGVVNLANIQTILIQNAGRFCEHYASDVLYDIIAISDEATIPKAKENDTEELIFTFGIRQQGVDGNGYITARLKDTSNPYKLLRDYYRKILAVKMIKTKDNIWCGIKDITKNINVDNL